MLNFLFSDLVSFFNIATVNPKKQKRGAHILRAHHCPSIRDEKCSARMSIDSTAPKYFTRGTVDVGVKVV